LIGGGYVRAIGEEDRVAINPFGMGAHDVALATHVYAAAVEQTLGTLLDR
jgi:N-[(2S)-2-amino-2-carboxyethyl]-L-glutamate dehydrogenase